MAQDIFSPSRVMPTMEIPLLTSFRMRPGLGIPAGLVLLGLAGAALLLPAGEDGGALGAARPVLAALFGFLGGVLLWSVLAPSRRPAALLDEEAGTLTERQFGPDGQVRAQTVWHFREIARLEVCRTPGGVARLIAANAGGATLFIAEGRQAEMDALRERLALQMPSLNRT